MANQQPFLFVDAGAAASALCQGMDPRELERCAQGVMKYLYASLPDAPISAAAVLTALPGPDPSSIDDRISALPATLLHDIVSRLPTKDAACAAVLSRRWRPVWRTTPLTFADAHLLPGFLEGRRQPTRADTSDITAAVSCVLATHPGPFRAIHLACYYMGAHVRHLARWVQALADKGVQDLVLINRS